MSNKRVRLIYMSDQYSPPIGTEGEVQFEDDLGNIHVKWDNGSTLALIPGLDVYSIIE